MDSKEFREVFFHKQPFTLVDFHRLQKIMEKWVIIIKTGCNEYLATQDPTYLLTYDRVGRISMANKSTMQGEDGFVILDVETNSLSVIRFSSIDSVIFKRECAWPESDLYDASTEFDHFPFRKNCLWSWGNQHLLSSTDPDLKIKGEPNGKKSV